MVEARLVKNPKVVNPSITAWGETKSLEEWALDPRSTTTRVQTIKCRLTRGYHPEEAISLPRIDSWASVKHAQKRVRDRFISQAKGRRRVT